MLRGAVRKGRPLFVFAFRPRPRGSARFSAQWVHRNQRLLVKKDLLQGVVATMIVTFVMDDLSDRKNGTTMTALRFAQGLRERGHEVRLVGYGAQGDDAFAVGRCYYPVVDTITERQGFVFGRPDMEMVHRAVKGADIVHLFLPFKLERAAMDEARRQGVPVSGAFHLQPENMVYGANLEHIPGLIDILYHHFRSSFYDDIRHVHCPSQLVADDLTRRYGYHSQMHAISNGVSAPFVPGMPARPFDDGLFHIVTVGRLSAEKSQATLFEAARLSRHADQIKLHVCGIGPLERELHEEARGMAHAVDFGFLGQAELIDLLRAADLYVHCSVADSEGISCLEAIACGMVPVFAEADRSATKQFALDGRSLYPALDAPALAERIDYWIEHPKERAAMAPAYAAEGERYRLWRCVERFEAMERQAIEDDLVAYGVSAHHGGHAA